MPQKLFRPDGVIPTYARSTILRVPPAPTIEADRELLRATARRVLAGEFPKPSSARGSYLIERPIEIGEHLAADPLVAVDRLQRPLECVEFDDAERAALQLAAQ